MNQKKEIKKAIEQILGSKITLRDDSSSAEDELKSEFVGMMEKYQSVWNRQNDLLENQGINFTSYDEDYFKVIEGLIKLCFDSGAADAILFYVYSRKDKGEELKPYTDQRGKEHNFKNVDDLWEFLLYWAEEIMKI